MINPKFILALDFSTQAQAQKFIDQLDPQFWALKIGKEMFTRFGPNFIKELNSLNFKIFLDLKFHDIPNTVANACKACAELGVWMINVHASGGLAMLKAAREALAAFKQPPLLIAVTVLTSFQETDLQQIGIQSSVEAQVERLVKLSVEAKLDGVVCSVFEVPLIKTLAGQQFLTITPGIRLAHQKPDDQSRVATIEQALSAGSDYLVLGRAVTRAENPQKVMQDIRNLSFPTLSEQ